MSRVRIALVILVCLIVLCAGSAFLVNSSCSLVQEKLSAAQNAEISGSNTKAEFLCSEAYNIWKRREGLMGLCVSYDKLNEADRALCRLEPLLREECEEFSAEIETAHRILERLRDGESFGF